MRAIVALLGCMISLACQTGHAAPSTRTHATYAVYAGGLHVADVEAVFSTDARAYRMELAYHTTGLVGFFYRGRQFSSASGVWERDRAVPRQYHSTGVWRGQHRVVLLDYAGHVPIVRQLEPPNEAEREAVPAAAQANSIDALSALLNLVRTIEKTGQCDTTVRVYDGRRVSEIGARTSGDEVVPVTDQSIFAGRALRCDFQGRMVAGHKLGGDRAAAQRPLHGSAWFAALPAGAVKLPVRLTFETRWFGDATMVLTAAEPSADAPRSER